MLETYFVKPATIDRVRGSWIGAEIEGYVVWLSAVRQNRPPVVRGGFKGSTQQLGESVNVR